MATLITSPTTHAQAHTVVTFADSLYKTACSSTKLSTCVAYVYAYVHIRMAKIQLNASITCRWFLVYSLCQYTCVCACDCVCISEHSCVSVVIKLPTVRVHMVDQHCTHMIST